MSSSPALPVLFLVRHARAGGPQPGERDFDRHLDPVGERDAARLAARVVERNWDLGHVVCSPALRCRQTAGLLLERARHASFTCLDTLYDGTVDAYLNIIADADPAQPLTLVGHNPTIEHLAFACLGSAPASRALPAGVQPGTLIAIGRAAPREDDVADDLPRRLVDVLTP